MWLNITHGKTVWINMIYIYLLRFNLTKYKYIYVFLYIYIPCCIYICCQIIFYIHNIFCKKKHLIYAHQHSSQLCCTASGPDVHLVSCYSYDGNHWKDEEWSLRSPHMMSSQVFFLHMALQELLWHIFLRPAGKLHLLGVQGVFVMGVVEGSRSFLIDSEVNCRNALVPVFTNLSCI